MFLGIEIGGTKLQLALGSGDGNLLALWRGSVNPAEGGDGIREQIVTAVPELLASANVDRSQLRGVGVGFGGPTDDATQSVIKSHHIDGWTGFPLAAWLSEAIGLPTVICNDADVAGLGEALHGAGKGLSPIFYVTVGTGIGGGLIIQGEIYRGVGKGAAEIGHLIVNPWEEGTPRDQWITEAFAAGWGIERMATQLAETDPELARYAVKGRITGKTLASAARDNVECAKLVLSIAIDALATALTHTITLLCPRRIVIGGGVSLMGEDLFFDPLRKAVAAQAFQAFAGITDIVPAALGEEVVLHGALALAQRTFRG